MVEVLFIKLKDGYFFLKFVVVGLVELIVGVFVVIVVVVKDFVFILKIVFVVIFIELYFLFFFFKVRKKE